MSDHFGYHGQRNALFDYSKPVYPADRPCNALMAGWDWRAKTETVKGHFHPVNALFGTKFVWVDEHKRRPTIR